MVGVEGIRPFLAKIPVILSPEATNHEIHRILPKLLLTLQYPIFTIHPGQQCLPRSGSKYSFWRGNGWLAEETNGVERRIGFASSRMPSPVQTPSPPDRVGILVD